MKNYIKVSFCLFLLFSTAELWGQGDFFKQGEGGVYTSERLSILKGWHGETADIGNNPGMLNLYSDMRVKFAKLGEEIELSLSDIDGSIYLQEDFTLGTLYDEGVSFKKIYLRFDAYNDEVQLKHIKESDKIESLIKNQSLSCTIDGEKYRYLEFVDIDGFKRKGYLIALMEGGNYSFYVRKIKIFKEGKQAKTSLQSSFPHRFQDKTEFYITSQGESPMQFKATKKEVIEMFGKKNKASVKSYLKNNRIDLKREGDLIGLVKFVNTL